MNKASIGENELLVNSLTDHIKVNAECVERLMLIIGGGLSHLRPAIAELSGEWRRVNTEVKKELVDALKDIE